MMKTRTIVTALTILFTSFSVKAQVEKGSIWLGGHLSFYSTGRDVENVPRDKTFDRQLNLAPFAGKSFSKNSITGIVLLFRKQRGRSLPRGITNSRDLQYGAGIFYRKYRSLGKGWHLFGQALIDGVRIKRKNFFNEDPNDFEDTQGYHFSAEVFPGISYALSKSMHVEIGTANLLTAYYHTEKTSIKWPINNSRNEKLQRAGVSSDINSIFGGLRFGFRFLINNRMTRQLEEGKTGG